MGFDNIIQFPAEEDGCVYFYDEKKGCYRKICDIASFSELPHSIKLQIKADQEEAKDTLALPTD
jgi:hypothetical protein